MASPEVRAGAIAEARPPWDAVLETLWDEIAHAGGRSRHELDEELNHIRSRVQRMAAVVWDQQRRRHEARFGRDGGPEFVPRPIREQAESHVIIPDLCDAPASGLEAFASEYPDLVGLHYARVRFRPDEDRMVEVDRASLPGPLRSGGIEHVRVPRVAGALVGDVRTEVWEEDVERRPFEHPDTGRIDRGGYRADDVVGARGIERAFEDTLRGAVGVVIRDRDAGEQSREQPIGGEDVHLTIDAALQTRIEAILDTSVGLTTVQEFHANAALPLGTQLPASVVVLEIQSGEILAMASTPDTLGQFDPAQAAALQPWLVRGVQVAVPPGSIVKPLVLAAALTEGVIKPDSVITCNGHHFAHAPGIARCWIYRPRYGMATHGPLGAVEALARSCNSWFYELGDRLGARRLADWLAAFGLGEPLDIGLTPDWSAGAIEVAGTRPKPEDIARLERAGEAAFERIMLAIGQGRSTWTPLHAANAYATLARHGRHVPPTIVRGHVPRHQPQGRPIAPGVAALAIKGLEDVVRQPWGTGNHLSLPTGQEPIFRVEGVGIAAKTGTAQAPPWARDVDGDGVIEAGEQVTGLDHSWVVALLADEGGPWRYALAVLVEYGGSGGRVAGPIADQVVRAMQSEGLLGGPTP
jgi:penicillin-binding protein 2